MTTRLEDSPAAAGAPLIHFYCGPGYYPYFGFTGGVATGNIDAMSHTGDLAFEPSLEEITANYGTVEEYS